MSLFVSIYSLTNTASIYLRSCVNNEGNCTSLTALRRSTLRWIGIVDFMMINRVRLKLDQIELELGPWVSGRGCVD